MEIARLVLSYVDVLVWPALIAAVLIGYRATVQELLARIIRLDAVGVSATFDKVSQQAQRITGSDRRTTRPRMASELAEVERITPRDYTEARPVGEKFRAGRPIILDLSRIGDRDAKRLVDFAAGLVFQGRGVIERVTNKVFLLSPAPAESAKSGSTGHR